MEGQSKTPWECGVCGQQHDGLAMVFGAQVPDPWLHATPAEREGGELNADMCVLSIEGEWHYFLRGHIEIHKEDRRASLAPMFGWLCTELPYEGSTISIPALVHNREPGLVPFIQLDPAVDHPLVREQGTGMALHRLAEINGVVPG